MTYPCPFCRTTADLAAGCPGCGRGPDRDAAEVIRLDAEMPALSARLAQARTEVGTVEGLLRDAWHRRQAAAGRVAAAVRAGQSATAVPAGQHPSAQNDGLHPSAQIAGLHPSAQIAGQLGDAGRPGDGALTAGVRPRSAETSTKLVQNVLFLLGGLLLGTAAIVFTAVAWAQFGVGGRAALLAGFTALALAVPLVALRRGLTATAETFAAVGLLLVLLDGYAAWSVNLFGVAGGSALGYAGAVCATTAAIAAGYEVATGLAGPRFAALIVAQPVLPLVLGPADPDAIGWSFAFAAVAAADVAVVRLHRDRPGTVAVALRVSGHLLAAAAVFGSGVCALVAMAVAAGPGAAAGAGAALVVAAAVPVLAAVLARSATAQAVSGGALVVALAVAVGRPAALAAGAAAPVAVALTVGVLAVLVAVAGRRLPGAVRRGPWSAALLIVAGPALAAVADVARNAEASLGAAWPALVTGAYAPLGSAARAVEPGWTVPVTVLLLTGGLLTLLPRSWRLDAAVVGGALAGLSLPAAAGLPWWSVPAIDLAVATVALLVALRHIPVMIVAALLTVHAIAVGYARADVAAATLGALAVLGTLVAVRAAVRNPAPSSRETAVGGVALGVALLAVPVACWQGLDALAGVDGMDALAAWRPRAALAAVAALIVAVHVAGRRWPRYDTPARAALRLAAAGIAFWAPSGDARPAYAGAALIMVTVLLRAAPARWATAAAPPALLLLATTAGSLYAVLIAPYAWLAHAWSGRPAGVGLDPAGIARVGTGDAVALALLAVAVGVAGHRLSGALTAHSRLYAAAGASLPVLVVATPSALAAAGAPWPAVPAATLLGGLLALLTVALRRTPPAAPAPAGSVTAGPGSVTAGPGSVTAGPGSVTAGPGSVTAGPASAGSGTAGFVVVSARAVRIAATVVGAALVAVALAGALPTVGASLSALGVAGTIAAIVGAVGRSVGARTAGWLAASTAFAGFAYTAGTAAHVNPAFGVLAVAAATLALNAVLAGRRPAEAPAVQAAAQAGALCALLVTIGSSGHAAAVCALWGVALGLRALRPGERPRWRRVFVVAAATAQLCAWWLLIEERQVRLVEAYTVPAAAVALLAGWLWMRTGREHARRSSWTAYGPALAAALLPTCALVVNGDGSVTRRLLFGIAGLVVLLLGARLRLQAPVVAGGAALVVTSLHEVVMLWDLLPRWIPLGAGGLLLVVLATTVERRRQELTRLRSAVTRMG